MRAAPSLLIAAVTFVALGFAQKDDDPAPQPSDPPSRVARLNWISGDVSFQPAGLNDWTDATVNYPLTTNDHLFTADGARAEIHIGPNAIRLDSNTNFGFLNLNDDTVQMSLTQGSIEIRLRLLGDDDSFEIATPNGAITLLRTGDYRIDTDSGHDATMLTVRSGQADLYSDGKSLLVRSKQTAYFRDGQTPDIRTGNDPDDFDSFTSARNESEDIVPGHDYLPAAMTGAQDLYTNGSWQNTPDYGWTWTPPVTADWSPYSTGRWAFAEPWGWTWIDDAAWGFAPFHYGRWACVNGTWMWVPGARDIPVIYSPALVVFFDSGANVSWLPLGPHDPYLPAWRGSTVSGLPPRYFNRRVAGAVRTISRSDFVSARRVVPGAGMMAPGQTARSTPSVVPVRESVLAGNVRARPALPERNLVARTPPPAAPISFEARQHVLAQNGGQPLAPQQVDDLRRQQPGAVLPRTTVIHPDAPQPSPRVQQSLQPGTQAPPINGRSTLQPAIPSVVPRAQPAPVQSAPPAASAPHAPQPQASDTRGATPAKAAQ